MSRVSSKLLVATAQSGDTDAADAVTEVVRLCRARLGRAPKGAILFAASSYDLEMVVATFRHNLPDVPMIGCTSNALFSNGEVFERDSVGLCLFAGDGLLCQVGAAFEPGWHPERVVELGHAHASMGRPALTFLLQDGLAPNAARVVEQLIEGLGNPAAHVVGGVAADQHRFEQPAMFFGDKVVPRAALALSLYGPFDVAIQRAQGWTPVGASLRVTHAVEDTIYELDNQRALDVVRGRLGTDDVDQLRCYPFAVNVSSAGYDYLRTIRSVDPQRGSVTCYAPVPEGALVAVSDAQRSTVLAASETVGLSLREDLEAPDGLLVFSSATREVVLGTRAPEEGELIVGAAESTPVLGMYGYGEIATGGPSNRFHNNSCIAVALRGRSA